MAVRVASSAPTSKFPRAKTRRTAPTSKYCSITYRSRSISNSIWLTVSSIGPTAAILRAATPSIARQSIKKAVPEILITHLMEGIGIALDVPGNRMFVTDLAGSVYSADLDGKNERNLLYGQGNLTGVAYAEI